jgi:xanthosine utilization system XapX-like protein
MKPSFIVNLIVAALLAALSYSLLPILGIDMPSNIALALGLFLGGILAPVIGSLFGKDSSSGDSDDGMSKTLYVGNLPYRANEQSVQEHFELQGHVHSVRLMKDRRTGKRKGYGFVEMDANGAQKAIKNLNDSDFQERTLKVRMAKDKIEEE